MNVIIRSKILSKCSNKHPAMEILSPDQIGFLVTLKLHERYKSCPEMKEMERMMTNYLGVKTKNDNPTKVIRIVAQDINHCRAIKYLLLSYHVQKILSNWSNKYKINKNTSIRLLCYYEILIKICNPDLSITYMQLSSE